MANQGLEVFTKNAEQKTEVFDSESVDGDLPPNQDESGVEPEMKDEKKTAVGLSLNPTAIAVGVAVIAVAAFAFSVFKIDSRVERAGIAQSVIQQPGFVQGYPQAGYQYQPIVPQYPFQPGQQYVQPGLGASASPYPGASPAGYGYGTQMPGQIIGGQPAPTPARDLAQGFSQPVASAQAAVQSQPASTPSSAAEKTAESTPEPTAAPAQAASGGSDAPSPAQQPEQAASKLQTPKAEPSAAASPTNGMREIVEGGKRYFLIPMTIEEYEKYIAAASGEAAASASVKALSEKLEEYGKQLSDLQKQIQDLKSAQKPQPTRKRRHRREQQTEAEEDASAPGSAGWAVEGIINGKATIRDPGGREYDSVESGSTVPGLGTVETVDDASRSIKFSSGFVLK